MIGTHLESKFPPPAISAACLIEKKRFGAVGVRLKA